MYRVLVAACALIMAACAVHDATPSAATPQAGQIAEPPAQTQLVAQEAAEPDTGTPAEEGIEVVAVPGVSPASAGTAKAATGSSSEVVCRREIPTGSRLAVRVCRTRAEIDARQQRDQAWLDEKQQDGLAGMGGTNF